MSGLRRNMAFGRVSNFLVAVHNKHAPSDDEWAEYMQFGYDAGIPKGILVRVLIVTAGGAPTPEQRKIMDATLTPALRKNPTAIRTAIVTSATFVQGVVAAMSFTNPIYRAFPPDKMKEAYDYLGVPTNYVDDIEALVESLKAELNR